MAVLLALVWLPAANHCGLEHLPGLAFLACDGSAGGQSHQSQDCQTDGCASVESGHYRTEPAVDAPAHALEVALLAVFSPVAPDIAFAPARATVSVPIAFPPSWQFTLRLALPPRAPSVAA